MAPRPRTRRLSRTLLAALVAAAVAVPVSGAARPSAVPAPAPAPLAPLRAATAGELAGRYEVNRAGIRAAERMAARHGDLVRAAALRPMASPARQFLTFDGRDGGRTVEAFGDLARARRIAVLVPGSDTGLDTYGRLRAGAVALRRQLGDRAAVLAWLGYETPGTVSADVVSPARATAAAPQLRSFIGQLRSMVGVGVRITVLCHSYGSVVCGRAASGLAVGDIVLYGSPGTGADSVAGLHTRARVWAGRGGDDWVAEVPHMRWELPFCTLGLGADPVSRAFGARPFAAGPGGHSDYLKPGSLSLANLARIVNGQHPVGEVRRAA
ncbi:alpha/beta hydrolase [Streptomyces sp. NPDC059649]|uniref:alpha/beta hydrolase n=1 Tax=Streptomyces sp. NPDC059649 TaxID=3346895 RepID=UPI003691A09D